MNPCSIGSRALARFARKPARILWFALPLMAMESPSCVMSERPLTRFQSDSIDESLLGEWQLQEDEDNRPALRVGMRDPKTMEFHWTFEAPLRDGGYGYLVLLGYVSTLNDRTFANLQFVDAGCRDCTDELRAGIREDFLSDYAAVLPDNPANSCTYMIIPYEHRGDGTLKLRELDASLVLEAIEAGQLDGSDGESAGPGQYDDICITASRRAFRRFILRGGPALVSDDGPVLVPLRASASAGL